MIQLLIQLHIQESKVIHVRYLEVLVLRIKQCARRLRVILVLVIQRRMNIRGRTIHRGASGLAVCATTQIPPPPNPVPPAKPVSVYLHRNVPESMEMNQTVPAVSVVLIKDVLLVLIVLNLRIFVHHVLLQFVRLQME